MLGALLFWLVASVVVLGAAFIVNGTAEPSRCPVPRVPWTREEGHGWLIIVGVLVLAVGVAYAGHVFSAPHPDCSTWKVYTFTTEGGPILGPVDPCR